MSNKQALIDNIRISATSANVDMIRAALNKFDSEVLSQISHAEKTIIGFEYQLNKPANINGYFSIPKQVTHVFCSQGDMYFALPDGALVIKRTSMGEDLQNLKYHLNQ